MVKSKLSGLKRTLIMSDIVIILLSFIFSYYFRYLFRKVYRLDLFKGAPIIPQIGSLSDYLLLAIFIAIIWILCLISFKYYNPWTLRNSIKGFYTTVQTGIATFILVVFIFFILHQNQLLSRTFLSLSIVTGIIMLNIGRRLIIPYLGRYRRHPIDIHNILIVSENGGKSIIEKEIEKRPELGIKIIGRFDLKDTPRDIQSRITDFEKILGSNPVDEVIFFGSRTNMGEIEKLMEICEAQGISSSIILDFPKMNIYRMEVDELFGIPMINFSTLPSNRSHLLIKRLIDIVGSIVFIIISSPILLFAAIGIKLTSKGPILYKQERVTVNGRKFILYKFRSMVQDAEKRLQELLPYNEMSGPVFKMKNDPRITKFGKFIRRYSIDELPQIFNVLKGDMSLVGPRPPIPSEVERYEIWQQRRLSMRPGLTCLWQISGRNEVDFDEWMKLDLQYIDNWSLWLDFTILLKTIPVVLSGKGAR